MPDTVATAPMFKYNLYPVTPTLSVDDDHDTVTEDPETALVVKFEGDDGARVSFAGAACTTAVGADCAVVEPREFVAVTTTRIV